jgi:hypothetical protein
MEHGIALKGFLMNWCHQYDDEAESCHRVVYLEE